MRPPAEIEKVLALVAQGHSDVAVAKLTGIPRTTIKDWRRGRLPGPHGFGSRSKACPICLPEAQSLSTAAYAYVLWLYLGDGYVSPCRRTYRLRIFLDSVYPGIVRECRDALQAVRDALQAVRPENRVWVGHSRTCRCNIVSVCSNHWPCLLPQMGPGRKHDRLIRLEEWQEEIVGNERRPFIRELIHSDGCRVVANDRGVASVRYHFTNKSEDIKRIFCDSLDALNINWTRPCGRQIAVYRKASTALLDDFVGPKQ